MITKIKKLVVLVLVCMLSVSVVSCNREVCDHSYGKWTVKKAATCEEKGNKVRECKECGEQDKKSIPTIDHDFDEDGICTMCHRSKEEMITGGNSVITPSEYPTINPSEIPTETPTENPTEDPTEAPIENEYDISVGQQIDFYVEGYTSKYFKFIPDRNGEYIFYSDTYDSTIDPSVTLLDCNMEYIDGDDDGGDNWNFSIGYYMYAGETYYFRVEAPQSGTIYVTLDEYGLDDATGITAGNYVSVNIEYPNAAKYYYFTADYSGTYVVYTHSSYGDIDAYGQVLDQYGASLIASIFVDDGNETYAWFSVEEGQVYYIVADCGDDMYNVSYDLKVDKFADFLTFNTVDYLDDWRYVYAANGDSKTYYAFTPSANGKYIISSKPYYDDSDYNAFAILYDCYGNRIATDNEVLAGGGIYIECDMFAGQTYFLEATCHNNGYSAEYYVCFSYEKNYYSINPGYSKDVNVEISLYKEYFTFTPEYSGTYDFYSTSDYYLDTYGRLYDVDWSELASNDSDGENGNFCISYYLEAGQTYIFEAGMWSDLTGSFTVHFEAKDVFDPTSTIQMNVGDSNSVYIYRCGACKYFAFTPSSSGYYCFTSNSTGDYLDTYAELNDEWQNRITYDDNGADNSQFKIMSYLEAGQTYYLHVGSYDAGEFDVWVLKADQLSCGYSTSVYVQTPYYKEYFVFVPEDSGTYYFCSKNDDDYDTFATMYDQYGDVIVSDDGSGENGNFLISCYLEAGQTYIFEAGMYDDKIGSFELYFDTSYPGDIIEIALDEQYYVYLTSGDSQYFIYTPTSSGYYRFTSTGGS